MDDLRHEHQLALAGHFSGKVDEMAYQLGFLVEACNAALDRFNENGTASTEDERTARYSFSAFANALQALKDIAPTFLGEADLSSEVRKLRHGQFVVESRNAMTHDGHPVVSAWVDGRFYVPTDIVRFAFKKPITIAAPKEDIRTVALEFSLDLCVYLIRLVDIQSERKDRDMPVVDIKRVERYLNAIPLVPPFVKEMFAANRDAIAASLLTNPYDFYSAALKGLEDFRHYCEQSLNSR